MVITYPLLTVADDSGAITTGATVTVASVTDKAGSAISSPGETLNQAGANVSVDYDAEAKGEAWITLAISKVGSTFTGANAAPAFYLARDSSRTLNSLPNAAPAASGGLPTVDGSNGVKLSVGTGAGQVNSSGGKVPATVASGDDADAAAVKATLGVAGIGLTNLGDARIANLNATVSSRSTYAGADTSGTAQLLTRLPSALTISGGKVAATVASGDGVDSAAVKVVTDKLATGLQSDGDGGWQFTVLAVANSPAGGGSGGGASLAQIQSELNTRGLTEELTTTISTNLDARVSTRSTYSGGAVQSVTDPVTVGTNEDKGGYSLAATGLDAITATAHSGPATTFPQMLVQLWRRFFRKATEPSTVGASGSQLLTYADDGTTILTTQVVTDDGTTQTQGAAS